MTKDNETMTCRVLEWGTGPGCAKCNEAMDKLRIEAKNHPNNGEIAYYCYLCTPHSAIKN